MQKKYTDYFHDTVLTIPENYINVKTGQSEKIISKVQEQIAYHAKNNTLSHLVFSALHDYLHASTPKQTNRELDNAILDELLELKRMLLRGYTSSMNQNESNLALRKEKDHNPVGMKEIEDLLEAFGG